MQRTKRDGVMPDRCSYTIPRGDFPFGISNTVHARMRLKNRRKHFFEDLPYLRDYAAWPRLLLNIGQY